MPRSKLNLIDDIDESLRNLIAMVPGMRRVRTAHWSIRIIYYLIPLGLIVGLGFLAWDGYERIKLGGERPRQVDAALKDEPPVRESHYCRRLFGYGVEYPGCYAAETRGYQQYKRAWELGRDLGTIREQLIGCYFEGRRAEGMSWAASAHCAEADMPGIETVQQGNGNGV